jgi:hypothetical protein
MPAETWPPRVTAGLRRRIFTFRKILLLIQIYSQGQRLSSSLALRYYNDEMKTDEASGNLPDPDAAADKPKKEH